MHAADMIIDEARCHQGALPFARLVARWVTETSENMASVSQMLRFVLSVIMRVVFLSLQR